MQKLQGFHVRPPTADEIESIQAFFPHNPLGRENLLMLGAFGQPGDWPLGAAMVRPSLRSGEKIGHFVLAVHPQFRRQKVGSRLVDHLIQLALKNGADRLTLAGLIQPDRPEAFFYPAVGFSIERTFRSFSAKAEQIAAKLEVAARRGGDGRHLPGARVVPLTQHNCDDAAKFVARFYGGFADERRQQIEDGYYDRAVSMVLLRRDELAGVLLARSKPGEKSVFLDVMVVTPNLRSSCAAAMMCWHSARAALEAGFTHGAFEGDEKFDRFAIGIARRCGARGQTRRYRFGISKAEMEARMR